MKKIILLVLFPFILLAQAQKTVTPSYVKSVVGDSTAVLRGSIATKLTATDTLSLSNRINTKLTASALADSISSRNLINATQAKALISDSIAGKLNSNFYNSLTEKTTPDGLDQVIIVDNEAGTLKYGQANNLPPSTATESLVNTKTDNISAQLNEILNAVHQIQDTMLVFRYEINALKSYSGQPLPIPPQQFKATASTVSKTITLNWSLIGTIDSVVIERRTTGAWARLTKLTTEITYDDNSISYDVNYWYRAKSYYNDQASVYSDSSTAKVITPTYLLSFSAFDFGNLLYKSTSQGGLVYDTIWSARTQQNGTAWTQGTYTPYNLRMLVSSVDANYDSIQIAVKPPQGTAISIDKISFGQRSGSTFNFTTTPTPITFSGNRSTGTLSTDSSQYLWSDIIPYQIRTGTSYLVHRYRSAVASAESYVLYGSNNRARGTPDSTDIVSFTGTADGRLASIAYIRGVRNLGTQSNGDTTKTFFIANNSGVTLRVDSLKLNNSNFTISYSAGNISSGSVLPVNVTFDRNKSNGTYSSTLSIYHSGSTTPQTNTIVAVVYTETPPSVNPPTNFWATGGLFRIDGGFTAPSGNWDSVVVYNGASRITKVDRPITQFVLTGLPHNTNYVLSARTVYGGVYSSFSNSVTVRTTDTTTYTKVLNYYVDATNGNDNNNGLTPSTAWRTLSRVNSASFNTTNGNVYIGLKRGEVWYESLNPSASGSAENRRIILTCYGTANRLPIITGATNMKGSSINDWSNYSGNIWRRAVTTSVDNYHYFIFEKADGSAMNWGYNKGSTITNVNEEYAFAISSGYLYVYATSNPYTYFNKIERTGRVDVLINMDRAYWTLDSLEIYGAGETNLRSTGSHLTFNGCNIHHTGNGSVSGGGTGYGLYPTSQYFTLRNSKIWEVGGHGIYVGAWNTLRNNNAVIENNVFANNTYTHIDIQTSGTSSFQVGGFIIRNNYLISDSSFQIARYNNSGAGIQVLGSRDGGIAKITNVKIYNNIIIGNNWGAINWNRMADTIEVYNNTWVNNGSYIIFETYQDGTVYQTPTWMFMRNNVFYSNAGGRLLDMTNDTNKVFSNNLYITSNSNPFSYDTQRDGGTWTTWANWSNPTLWLRNNGAYPDGDANSQFSSTTTNIFTTFTNKDGVKNLKPYPGGTLATAVGYDLSAIFNTDFNGNVRTGTWRVGAILP